MSLSLRYNNRASDMLEAILKSADFNHRSVLDLGCGYGDLIVGIANHGAKMVVGVDQDPLVLSITQSKLSQYTPEGVEYTLYMIDINSRSDLAKLPICDVVLCTSVLPYIKNRDMLLSYMSTKIHTSFIEMQYFGDGPGPREIKDDDDMREWLNNYWISVRDIGRTFTGRDPAYRTIWKCTQGDFNGQAYRV